MGFFERIQGYEKRGELISHPSFDSMVEIYVSAFLNTVKKLTPEDEAALKKFVNNVFGDVIDKLKK